MKILFINPHYTFDPYTLLLHPPLAYGSLSNFLKKDGHEVFHADLPFCGNQAHSAVSFIEAIKPDIIGLTCVAQSFYHAKEIATLIKENFPYLPIVIGGPLVTFVPTDMLLRHSCFDYLILYDGEDSFAQLAIAIEQKASAEQLKQIDGLAFKDMDGSIIITEPAAPVFDLDYYPIPDRTIFDLDNYRKYDYETVIVTSRGCPSRCSFCSTTLTGRNFRFNSPVRVVDEIEEVLDMGFNSVFFGDDTFSGNSKRVIEICKELNRRNSSAISSDAGTNERRSL